METRTIWSGDKKTSVLSIVWEGIMEMALWSPGSAFLVFNLLAFLELSVK